MLLKVHANDAHSGWLRMGTETGVSQKVEAPRGLSVATGKLRHRAESRIPTQRAAFWFINAQSTHSQHTVNIQSTYSQHTVNTQSTQQSTCPPLLSFLKGNAHVWVTKQIITFKYINLM